MNYLPVILVAALTALGQTTPQPTATLKEGGTCALDKHDPSKLKCRKSSFLLSIDVSPRVSLIDGKGPEDFGLKPGDSFNPKGKFLVSITPGQHTVQMSFFELGGGSYYRSEPLTVMFGALPGHTYSANALVSGSRLKGPTKWIPLIYDETDSHIVSLTPTQEN
jgi:hypothetical protein